MNEEAVIANLITILNTEYDAALTLRDKKIYNISTNKCLFNTDGYNFLYNLIRLIDSIPNESVVMTYDLHFEFFTRIMEHLEEKYHHGVYMDGDFLVARGKNLDNLDSMNLVEALITLCAEYKNELI